MLRWLLLCVLGIGAVGQQPNSAVASLEIDGASGPPFPIGGLSLNGGQPSQLDLSGLPSRRVSLFLAAALAGSGVAIPGGDLIDLDLLTLAPLWDGIADGTLALDGSGVAILPFSLSAPLWPAGSSAAIQAAMEDPSALLGLKLSAASAFSVLAGVATYPLGPLFEDNSQVVDLSWLGTSVTFFQQVYTQIYVNANGYVTCGLPVSDFTPTPAEMMLQAPRLALFWTDLSPQNGGSVTVTVDFAQPTVPVRVLFDQVPEFGTGVVHRFAGELSAAGDVRIESDVFNLGPPQYTVLVGMSPGFGMSPGTGQRNLLPLASSGTSPGEAVFEWFGTAASSTFTAPNPNPYDLTGRTFWAMPDGVGGHQVLVW